jgi:hypothetical protein
MQVPVCVSTSRRLSLSGAWEKGGRVANATREEPRKKLRPLHLSITKKKGQKPMNQLQLKKARKNSQVREE